MPKNPLELIPAAFSGCAHDETCRNMAVMEALRVKLTEAESLSEERRVGWVAQSALSAEVAVRLGDVIQERDAALAQVATLREALQDLYDMQNGPPLIKYEKDWNAAMKNAEVALARPFSGSAQPEVTP